MIKVDSSLNISKQSMTSLSLLTGRTVYMKVGRAENISLYHHSKHEINLSQSSEEMRYSNTKL